MALIKHRQLVEDPWQTTPTTVPPPDNSPVCVEWSTFKENPAAWQDRPGPFGVMVPGELPVEALTPYLDSLALIKVNFPKFTDGRGYSLARLLRGRFGYQGELRATGDILRDQLLFLERCGFDAFELKAGKNPVDALEAFAELPVRYQKAGDGAVPPWKRRKTQST